MTELLTAPAKTSEVVNGLKRLLGAPLRAALPHFRPLVEKATANGCPCQFLMQEIFELPATLRPNLRNVFGRWFPSAKPETFRDAYLGLTVTHACGDSTAAYVRWGLNAEPGARQEWSGAKPVFTQIQKQFEARGYDVSFGPVPNRPEWNLAFVGRKLTTADLTLSASELVAEAASDLQALATFLSAGATP